MGPTAIAIAGLVVSAAGGIAQYSQQKKAQKAQNRAAQEQRALDALKQRREQLKQVKELRIRQGRIRQGAANAGAANSSAPIGGVGSLASQTNANLNFLSEAGFRQNNTSHFLQQASNATSKAATYGAVSSFGMQVFNAAGGFDVFSSGDSKNVNKPEGFKS